MWFGEAAKAIDATRVAPMCLQTPGARLRIAPHRTVFLRRSFGPLFCRIVFDTLRYVLLDFDTLKGIAMPKAKSGKARLEKARNGKTKSGVGVLFYVTPACDAFIDETRKREGKTRSQWFRHLLATHYNRPDLATMPEPGRPRASTHNAGKGTKEEQSRK
jgi:hypothetical protein